MVKEHRVCSTYHIINVYIPLTLPNLTIIKTKQKSYETKDYNDLSYDILHSYCFSTRTTHIIKH